MASRSAPSHDAFDMPSARAVAGWLVVTLLLFVGAELVGARRIPSVDAAAAAAIALRVAALLATLAGVAGYARRLRDSEAARAATGDAERAHEARSALAAIEHAARALPPSASPLPLGDAIVSEVAVIRRLFDTDDGRRTYSVAEALLGPITAARLAGAAIDVSLEDGLIARGDPAAVGQIVQGLVDNARRHAPGASIRVRGEFTADMVELVVADDGPGIPASLRAAIFDAGVRSPTGGGSGLGLAAARRLARDQGGRLTLLPTDRGATFRVELPAAVGVAAPS